MDFLKFDFRQVRSLVWQLKVHMGPKPDFVVHPNRTFVGAENFEICHCQRIFVDFFKFSLDYILTQQVAEVLLGLEPVFALQL